MTKQKSTKKAFLSSVLSLVLCMAMLIGTTFAWFTDSVTSTGNIIKSGKLDVELNYKSDFNGTWASVTDKEEAIFNYDKWEPGYVDVKYIQVANVGNLAFKYLLNIIPETIAAEGETNLADVIDVYIVKNPTEGIAREDLATMTKVGTLSSLMSDPDGAARGILLPANGSDDVELAEEDAALAENEQVTLGIALKMQESAGNEYQDLTVGGGFDIQLLATQYTWENDSFDNQYDTNATYPEIWDGEVGTVPDAVGNTVTISTPAELAAFAAAVNDGNSYSGKTVVLANDINLGKKTWTPIGDCVSGKYFQGTFDGQGNTIYNLYVDKSTDESQYSTAGLFGWVDAAMAAIKNVNVDGATVLGSHWVGAIAGYFTGTIDNCSVNNATVVAYNVNDDANGDKVGGIVGCLNEHSYLNNNTVTNSTITGNRDIGGIAGSVATSTYEMSNNKVSDTVITYTTEKDYGSAGAIVSGRTGYTPDETNVATNVSIFKAVSDGLSTDANGNFYVYTAEGLQSLKNWIDENSNKSSVWGKEYNIMANIDATNVNWTTKFMVPDSATFDGFTFNGNGYTISNLIINGQGLFTGTTKGSQSTVPATFKNITFDNVTVTGGSHHNGVVWGEAYGSVTLEKVNVINSKVSGGCNVGGLVGRNSESHATFKFIDCSVKNTTVEATQVADYAGASAFLGMALHIGNSTSANVIFEGNNVAEGNTLTTAEGMQGGGIYTIATWDKPTWEDPTVVNDFTNYNSNN